MRRGAADGSTRAGPICGWLISTPPPVFRPLTPLVCLKLHRVKPDSHYKRLATQFVALKSSLSGRLIRTSRCKIVASRQGRQSALYCLSRWHPVYSHCPCCSSKAAKAAPGGVAAFSLHPPCPPARSSAPTIMAPNLAVAQLKQIHAMLQAGRFTADQIAKV
jgi:hypothetical protein